eukprot:299623-Pleurochrysis_carterae.AAC.1
MALRLKWLLTLASRWQALIGEQYLVWHHAIRAEPETGDEAGRENLALSCGVAAVRAMHAFEDGFNSAHKSWMSHIIMYIIPLFVARFGSLWRYSTAKLESRRGGRMKRVMRSTISWQPTGDYQRTIKKRQGKRRKVVGDGGNTTFWQKSGKCGAQQVIEHVILQEDMICSGQVRPRTSKHCKELGRSKAVRMVPKAQTYASERLRLGLTCVEAFQLMYSEQIPRIYDDAGALHPQYASSMFDAC